MTTITGIVSPSGLVKSSVGGLASLVLPGPSSAERAVDSLYEKIEGSMLWRFAPELISDSKQTLVDDWGDFDPDAVHSLPDGRLPRPSLRVLFEDGSLNGREVLIHAFVSQILDRQPVTGGNLVKVSFRLGVAEEEDAAWCDSMTLPEKSVPEIDQLVDVAGVVVARGSANVASGGFVNGTYLLCSAIQPLVSAQAAHEVAEMYRAIEGDSLWLDTPSMSGRAETHLMRSWDRFTPYRPHPFSGGGLVHIGIDQIYEDERFDGGKVKLTGYVTQRYLAPAEKGTAYEEVRLEVGGQRNAVWCKTTVQSWRIFQDGDYLEAVGVPVARGAARLENGDFKNETVFVCPAVRKWTGA